MPLVGYTCPVGGESPGRQNAPSYCLSECRSPCVTPPLLAAMYKADTENYHVGSYISSSMFADGGCARQVFYERRYDYYELPTKRYWPFRGTVAHRMIEGAGELLAAYGWVQELRMSTTLTYPELAAPIFDEHGGFTGEFDLDAPLVVTVSGTCDAFHPPSKTLVDMKTMADRKVEMLIKGEGDGTFVKALKDGWVSQMNIYRWLLSQTPIPERVHEQYARHGLAPLVTPCFEPPEHLVIQGAAMMHIPRTGGKLMFKEKRTSTVYDIPSVPVWSLQETEQFVRDRALLYFRALALGIAPPVVDKSKDWLCRNCAFNGELVVGGPCLPTALRRVQEG